MPFKRNAVPFAPEHSCRLKRKQHAVQAEFPGQLHYTIDLVLSQCFLPEKREDSYFTGTGNYSKKVTQVRHLLPVKCFQKELENVK